MVYVAGIVAFAALALSAVTAHDCQGNAIVCKDGTDSILLRCKDSEWETETCGAKQYCMTMAPGMVHCMLQPDDYTPTFSSVPSAASSTDADHHHASSSAADTAAHSSEEHTATHTSAEHSAAHTSEEHSAAHTSDKHSAAATSAEHSAANTTGGSSAQTKGSSSAQTKGGSSAGSSASSAAPTTTGGAHSNSLKVATIVTGLIVAGFAALV